MHALPGPTAVERLCKVVNAGAENITEARSLLVPAIMHAAAVGHKSLLNCMFA
jgi:hypothetical protein